MTPRPPLRVGLIQAREVGAHATGQGVGPPLGLLSIAAFAREMLPGRVAFEVHDTYFFSREETRRWLLRWRPEVVAISGLSPASRSIEAIALLARGLLGERAAILVGGPHATAYTEHCVSMQGVTGVVAGEGESPFLEFLQYALGERSIDEIEGLVRRDVRAEKQRGAAAPDLDIERLPLPAYDLVDLRLYSWVPNTMATIVLPPHRYVPLLTSRGCPYGCTYCHKTFGRRFRSMSVESVVSRIAHLARHYNVSHFHMYDDIFNARPGHLTHFCDLLKRERLGVRIYFVNGLRFDTLDRAQIVAMREAGVVYIAAAIESASALIQQRIGKRMDIGRLLENVALADQQGIFTTGFLMLGFPNETRDEMDLTIRTAERSRLHYAYFSVLNPYAGTAIGEELASAGFDVSPEQMVGYSSPGKNFAGIPEDEFRGIVRGAYRRFWTPERLVAFAARHPAPETIAAALLSSQTRGNLARRTLAVLGSPQAVDLASAWEAPRCVGATGVKAALLAGHVGRGLAGAIHRRARGYTP